MALVRSPPLFIQPLASVSSHATYDEAPPSPSEQLYHDLHTSITASLSSTPQRRPILTHLNADTTWLLSIPYPQEQRTHDEPSPETKQTRRSPRAIKSTRIVRETKILSPRKRKRNTSEEEGDKKKKYFHILIDPWLKGSQSDVAAFFSQQWHATPSAVQTIEEIEQCIWELEAVAAGQDPASMRWEKSAPALDCVAISHEFTDHMHEATLREIAPSVPIFATPKARGIIASWGHFDQVLEIERFGGDWRSGALHGAGMLPSWLSISRLAFPGKDLLYYHSAIMIAFSGSLIPSAGHAEAVIYTPHGISPPVAEPVGKAHPQIKTLALLHGLHDITLGAQLNMGAHNGLKIQRALGAHYWIGTHDEVKKGGGLISWWLKRKVVTLEDALKNEVFGGGKEGKEELAVRFVDLGNGESLILE
ncbi:hypothetical protein BP6252_06864 [Coleophoma cylindrospora]|uniref:Uncharacterized protein n=1 Tax=Coleophoma cylindrospora TaxID=1849047 RepID=A0A3D8RFZ4_9HELO|nr:hypothetical protein BP6252_06864 [Coleophoma cylindrospora]